MSTVIASSPFVIGSGVDAGRTVAPRTRLRLTRRGRVVLTSLAAVPVVAVALFAGLSAVPAVAGSSSADVSFRYVTIEPGQSLWSLAESLAPTVDPRDVIAEITSLNGLSSSSLEPGQQIAVPLGY
ncbi:LysM peptidoglycan-binding domain-containing protein [Agromyces atrinae]|uniref:LysM peptidoglycan-binding domain-containing protein n=1 Tax=Agromyces atrinae TaxID=592376 RepID=UPI001F58ED2A|nr:LysM peptidoglycan-binding domain-containing protein [Agromyces atrinae]MCI2958332.1 LysM peptidoglycan-binding domain-containing protein [Agromyces atrinae]